MEDMYLILKSSQSTIRKTRKKVVCCVCVCVCVCVCDRNTTLYQQKLSFLPIARLAMATGKNPVIIDNTNVAAWQMKPYVLMVSKTLHLLVIKS